MKNIPEGPSNHRASEFPVHIAPIPSKRVSTSTAGRPADLALCWTAQRAFGDIDFFDCRWIVGIDCDMLLKFCNDLDCAVRSVGRGARRPRTHLRGPLGAHDDHAEYDTLALSDWYRWSVYTRTYNDWIRCSRRYENKIGMEYIGEKGDR